MNKEQRFVSKTREFLVKQYLEALQQDKIPWEKGWNSMGVIRNAVTNKPYRGVNVLALNLIPTNDPRWCTFNQIKKEGWHLKKGSKGVPLEFWSMYDKVNKKTINLSDYHTELERGRNSEEFRVVAKGFTVFNGSDIEGIPELVVSKNNDIQTNEIINKMIENLGVKYQEVGNRAYYSPHEDSVTLPPKGQFKSSYEYNAVKLHELCHATGHETRLNRPIKNNFGTMEYAKEELRAEIGSSFLMQDLRIPISEKNIGNHKAYIQSWISILQKNPNELFSAIKDAEKISQYLADKGEIQKDLQLGQDAVEIDKATKSEPTKENIKKPTSLKEKMEQAKKIGIERRENQRRSEMDKDRSFSKRKDDITR